MNCPHCHAPNADEARFCGSCGKATSSTEPVSNPPLDAPGDVIGKEIAGRYRILAKLGEGGMGTVYRAEQISLKRAVALKMLRPDVGGGSLLLRRFNAEAEAVAKLSHPNTVNIFDFGQDADGNLFIAMEFIEGRSLRSAIHASAPFSLRRALAIAAQIASSIADAHSHAIIHRDLKPDNVMLQDRGKQKDVVRVLDFGIAKLRDDTRANNQMTQAGDMLGTPQYMAPEQIRAEQIDGRTDVYALGCMLYEMITARLPFEAPTVMALLSKHLMETPPSPSQRRPDLGLPPSIDELVMAAMAKDPAHRPPTMEQLGEHIAALLATLPADPAGPSAPVSVPYVPAPRHDTPPAPSAFAAPSGFGQPVPTPPPPSTFTPHVPPPPPYAPTPPPQPAYAPTPPPQPAPRFEIAQPPSGSKRTLLLVVGLLVLGAAGVGVYFATRGGKQEPIVDPSHGSADPWQNGIDAAEAHEPDDPSDDPPDHQDPPDPPAEGSDDPWGGKAGAAPAQPDHTGLAGNAMEIGQGAKFIVPPSFTVQTANGGVVAVDKRGLVFAFAPLDSDTDDANVLAQRYASSSGLKLLSVASEWLQGASRPYAVFEGRISGVKVRHVVVAFIGPSYRIAMIVHVPVALANSTDVQALALEAVTRRLVLPSAAM